MVKKIVITCTVLTAGLAMLSACDSNSRNSQHSNSKVRSAIITDASGITDRSFNQSAWEGLTKWGKENKLSKGAGYTYYQSASPSDYTANFNSAAQAGYNLQFGIGFTQEQAVETAAQKNPTINYVIIDANPKSKAKNLSSATFSDWESAYLAGAAAALTTKTNQIGFIGGQESSVIKEFEKGYIAGAKSVNSKANVEVQYTNSFTDAAKGKSIAHTMYRNGIDVIFQCTGAAGAGVFSEAKAQDIALNEKDKVWIIGVDQDQGYLGNYVSKDNKESNFVLASTTKEVGNVVIDMSNKAKKGKFPGGSSVVYNLKNGGVDIKYDNMASQVREKLTQLKQDIVSGRVSAP
ncbi:MAG: BMP family lipoprotein [Lactobacillaceae bacterium]